MDDGDLIELAREVVTLPGFRWDMPWCSVADEHGRVFRRNCSPDDPGFGWSQVAGPRLRCRWSSSSVVIDLRDAGSRGALHELVEEACGGPVSVSASGPTVTAWSRSWQGHGPTRAEALVALWREVPRG